MDIYYEAKENGREENLPLSEAEILNISSQIREARSKKEFELVYHLTKRLADEGHIPSLREWGAILEAGEFGTRDLDGAMYYFSLGAKKNDAYSAYRYSRLIGRVSEAAEHFWLLFSALLGCREAFIAAAELLDGTGFADDCTYFYTLAAECDNVDAIVTLAKRYYGGVGVEKNEAHARWYMDKLTIPPIYAIKLAYKLRGVRPEEPPTAEFRGRCAYIKRLAFEAKRLSLGTAEIKLCEMLAEGGDVEAMTRLGNLYADGAGGEVQPALAIATLERAALHGSCEAYISLGNIYLSGKFGTPDGKLALQNYKLAAELGMTNAYETMADIYREGAIVKQNIAKAAELYLVASDEGSASAREKLAAIVSERNLFYRRGIEYEKSAPEESFRAFTLAVSMGHPDSYAALARAYLVGIGTKPDRRLAFKLLKRAYEINSGASAFPLAMCYLRGIGIERSFPDAKRLLAEAAAAGDERGRRELLSVLEAKKKKLAKSLYSRAMRLLYIQKFEPALEALLTADSIGHAKSTYTLGCFYEFGLGVECDKDRAYSLYERAFENKFRDPRAAYKLVILKILRGKIKTPTQKNQST